MPRITSARRPMRSARVPLRCMAAKNSVSSNSEPCMLVERVTPGRKGTADPRVTIARGRRAVAADERPDTLVIAGREFRSRLFVGTGKYPSFQVMKEAHEASGTEVVTVAVRRVDLNARGPQ